MIPPPLAIPLNAGVGLDAASRREWLIGNGLGGFAMGTAGGVPARRYHGWLVAATNPPVGRVLALAGAVETLVLSYGSDEGEKRIDLSTFRFSSSTGGVLHPRGIDNLVRFELDPAGVARWEYAFGPVRVARELTLVHGRNAAIIRYRVRTGGHAGRIEIRPLIALRDFHGPLLSAEHATPEYAVAAAEGGARVSLGELALAIRSWGGVFTPTLSKADAWWRNFELVREAERGLDAHEDFFAPGVLELTLPTFPAVAGTDLVHSAEWSAELTEPGRPLAKAMTADDAIAARAARLLPMIAHSSPTSPTTNNAEERELVARLVCAADCFVVRRGSGEGGGNRSIIAGYPWFSDWGRDTLICLPGLLLTTGRFDEARAVLETFAAATREGVVPNCFDDRTGEALYNTADASLWYLHAACRWAAATKSHLPRPVLAACLSIFEWYQKGTRHGIRVEADGLLAAGEEGLALTWMDAKRDGVVFTPRMGKPIELQALWHSGLLELAELVEKQDPGLSRELRQVAYRCGDAINAKFWNTGKSCLYDVLTSSNPDASIRPNQIFAISQPHSALPMERRKAVFACVRDRLLTPEGLRTLDPREPGYQARYRGPLFERDRAYHNGTVWPWLIGAYARAATALGEAAEGRRAVMSVAKLLTSGASIGSIAEIYEADPLSDGTRRADGCPAQAWSVAESLAGLAETARGS